MKKLVSYILVFCCGIIAMKSYLVLSSYYRLPSAWRQGREIGVVIDKYKDRTGVYPDQSWYSERFPDPITSEGREWIYLNIPPNGEEKETLLIVTRLDYKNSYYGVYSGGLLKKVDINALLKKN